MAKVRAYEPGQVKANPLPSSRFSDNATADSFGGAQAKQASDLAKGLQGASQSLQGAAQAFAISNDRKDRAVTREALNSAQSDARLYMADLNRPENRQKAVDAYDTSRKQFDDIRRKYVGQLKNARQRDLFTASFDDSMNGHLDRALALQEKTRVDFDNETIAAQNQSAVETAVGARTDPAEIQRSEITIKANTAHVNRGLPVELRKKAVKDAVHNLHASVLSAVTLDSPVAAQGYLKQNWDKFNPAAREVLKKELDDKAYDFTVRQRSAEIANSGLSLDDQLKEADKEQDPKKADELRKRIKEKYEDKQLARKAQEQETVRQEWQALIQDPKGYQIPYEKFSDKKEWQAMEAFKRAALNSYGQASDIGLLMKLGLMNDQELREVPVEDMASYASQLTETDFKSVFGRYQALRGGKGAAEVTANLTQIRTDTTLVNDALKSVGIDLSTKEKKNKDTVRRHEQTADQFYRAFQSDLTQEEQRLGRKATPEEKQKLVDQLLIKGRVRNPDYFTFNDKDKFLFQVEDGDWKNFSVNAKDVPLDEQQKIAEALNRAGKPVTRQAVVNLYLRKLQSKGKTA